MHNVSKILLMYQIYLLVASFVHSERRWLHDYRQLGQPVEQREQPHGTPSCQTKGRHTETEEIQERKSVQNEESITGVQQCEENIQM